MADTGDEAAARADHFLAVALRNRQSGATNEIPAGTGRCLYCDYPVVEERRWCGPECRDGWEREQKRT